MVKPSVHAIVLGYNTKKWLENCFDSLQKTDYPNLKAIYVDNASQDGSAEFVKKKFPQVEVIENEKNLGFTEGKGKVVGLIGTSRRVDGAQQLPHLRRGVTPEHIDGQVSAFGISDLLGLPPIVVLGGYKHARTV